LGCHPAHPDRVIPEPLTRTVCCAGPARDIRQITEAPTPLTGSAAEGHLQHGGLRKRRGRIGALTWHIDAPCPYHRTKQRPWAGSGPGALLSDRLRGGAAGNPCRRCSSQQVEGRDTRSAGRPRRHRAIGPLTGSTSISTVPLGEEKQPGAPASGRVGERPAWKYGS